MGLQMGVVVREWWHEAQVIVKMRHAGHEPTCVNYYYCRIMLLLLLSDFYGILLSDYY
jgi:hypothetical protein